MENYAFEKEWLDTWATHYITGEKIPYEMIRRLKKLPHLMKDMHATGKLGFGFLDMAWHTITEPVDTDISEFESAAMAKTELFPED